VECASTPTARLRAWTWSTFPVMLLHDSDRSASHTGHTVGEGPAVLGQEWLFWPQGLGEFGVVE
jgi:hypothetical protein